METKEITDTSQYKGKPKSRQLQILVEANKLYNELPNATTPEELETLIDNCVALKDDNGLSSPFGKKKKTFLTNIYGGYKMLWTIKVNDEDGKDKNYDTALDYVSQVSKPDFFTKNPVNVKNDGTIEAKVLKDKHEAGKEAYYIIYFHVSKKNGSSTTILPLDPRLKINQ